MKKDHRSGGVGTPISDQAVPPLWTVQEERQVEREEPSRSASCSLSPSLAPWRRRGGSPHFTLTPLASHVASSASSFLYFDSLIHWSRNDLFCCFLYFGHNAFQNKPSLNIKLLLSICCLPGVSVIFILFASIAAKSCFTSNFFSRRRGRRFLFVFPGVRSLQWLHFVTEKNLLCAIIYEQLIK